MLHEVNYHHDREVCEIGRKLVEGQPTSLTLSFDQTSNIQQGLKLGRSGYQLLKSKLPQEIKILPGWKELRAEQNDITPQVIH